MSRHHNTDAISAPAAARAKKGERPLRAALLLRRSQQNLLPNGKGVPLPGLHQTPVLHHVLEDQGTLSVADVQERRQILPVGRTGCSRNVRMTSYCSSGGTTWPAG